MNSLPKNVQALAARLATVRGTSIERAVVLALEEALASPAPGGPGKTKAENDDFIRRIEEISARYRALPVLDPRSADEILGYDEFGVPS